VEVKYLGTLREKQKAEVKYAIVRAGEELFRTKGFTETTVEDITSTAGVARGTFYNYFQTKEDLAIEITYEFEVLTSEQIEEFFESIPETEQQIYEILRKTVEWTLKRPELVMITFVEKMKRGYIPQYSNASLFRRMMLEAFKRGQSKGLITQERQPQDFAHDLDGLYLIHMVRWYHSGRQYDLFSVLSSAVNTYLMGALTQKV
jgi:AcrR family transcriptional regulator